MKHLRMLTVAAATATLMLGLTACGDDATTDAQAEQTAPNGDVYNEDDVAFATAMIPHHAQALAMVDLARGRQLSADVQTLTEEIQGAQGPEIEEMVDWLTEWDKPVPETMRDHVNAEDHGMSGHDKGADSTDMPGMMTDEQMSELEETQGPRFETLWLEMMIEHHKGAIEMAKDEQSEGVFAPAKQLARSIETSQKAEIDRMIELLAS